MTAFNKAAALVPDRDGRLTLPVPAVRRSYFNVCERVDETHLDHRSAQRVFLSRCE
jgi:hypothetical protein